MRAREIIEFWEDVTTHMTEPSDTPSAEALATELVRRCEDMALAEQLSTTDMEKEIGGDLFGYFRRKLLPTEIECDRRSRGEP